MLAIEGDIFGGCCVSWTQYKTCILFELYKAELKLGRCSILGVTPEVPSEVAAAIEGAEVIGVQVDWLNDVIREIY